MRNTTPAERHDESHFQTLKACIRALIREFGEEQFTRILREAAELESARGLFEMSSELLAIYSEHGQNSKVATDLPAEALTAPLKLGD